MPHSGEILLRVNSGESTMAIVGARPTVIGDASENDKATPWVYPIGDVLVDADSEGQLFDDVMYTIQLSGPTKMEVTAGHRPLPVAWVWHRSQYIATTTWQCHQVGWTEMRVGEWGVRVKVSSRKMDYETDYRMMVQDLEDQVRGLTAKLVSGIVNPMDPTEAPFDLWSYWLALLENVWQDLARDVRYAWRSLPPQIHVREQSTYVDRMKRPQYRDLRSYMQRGNPRVVSPIREWQEMTVEHLYLVQLVQFIERKLQRIFSKVTAVAEHRRLAAIAQDATLLVRQLLSEVRVERTPGEPKIPESPLAQSNPSLRRIIRGHRLLKMGLFPEGDRYFVGPKDISRLYEYWCYLTIVRLVVEESGGILKVSPQASSQPMDILLASGKEHAALVLLSDGHSVRILYQRQYQGLPTVTQQPDHVVELQGLESLVVFDAKYRFELDDRSLNYYAGGSPIPPIDTINSMHQYHDAIVMSNWPYHRLVDRAIVLFPLPREHIKTWNRHRFYLSIDKVGVGALPLLPGGSDEYLREQIRQALGKL